MTSGIAWYQKNSALRTAVFPHVAGRSIRLAFVCRACLTAWGCKSPTQPDGGEGLAKCARASRACRALRRGERTCPVPFDRARRAESGLKRLHAARSETSSLHSMNGLQFVKPTLVEWWRASRRGVTKC